MKFSISQFKKYNASPAEWAGKYILGLPTGASYPESMEAGNIVEQYVTMGGDIGDMVAQSLEKYPDIDIEKLESKIHAAIDNGATQSSVSGQYQVQVKKKLHGHDMVGYIDVIAEDEIIDIKTPGKKLGLQTVSQFSNMPKQEEYELQLWFYMYATGIKKAKIVEYIAYPYKNKTIEPIVYQMDWTEEMHNKRYSRTKEKINEMFAIQYRFDFR